jgi:hypothetical protein
VVALSAAVAAGAMLPIGCHAVLGLDDVEIIPGGQGAASVGGSAPGGHAGQGGHAAHGGVGGVGGVGGGQGGGGLVPGLTVADKVDLLLVVDNSRSMGDKQQVLSAAVEALIDRLTSTGITDMHVGVITSSLGGLGSDSCDAPEDNDHAHLIDRDSSGTPGLPTYQAYGFLAWDPNQQLSPPGQADAGVIQANLEEMVLGAGELGCGFEAPLEAWYRFLIDPDPYDEITVVQGQAELTSPDHALLQQRANFLRPDSLLIILMITDENDCSVRTGGQYYIAMQSQSGGVPFRMPTPSDECAAAPDDPCCVHCTLPDAGACIDWDGGECDPFRWDPPYDNINVRCFDQKRRFGFDFLFALDRYITGLTSAQVPDHEGNLHPNPIYTDLQDSGLPEIRGSNLVILAGIVGVPWQDVARRAGNGSPDLINGLNADSAQVGGYQSGAELAANGTWDLILGDPMSYVAPTDPLMQESIEPRTGNHPITDAGLAPPDAGYMANPINGHEKQHLDRDDLQYACIFDLPSSRDCTAVDAGMCDCQYLPTDDPVCQESGGGYSETQFAAKAYPSLRALAVIKAMGPRGVVGSICPETLAGPSTAKNYGYQPVLTTLNEAVLERIRQD